MQITRIFVLSAICLTLAACDQKAEPAKPAVAEKPAIQAPATRSVATPAAPAAPATEAKKEDKPGTPEVHGMPGMSELFKDDAKK